jgi:glycosyltransferase involved in cell wall biosynthesis
MKDLAILMPCWKSPELLAIAIPSLIKASKSNHEIIVILNEADTESIHILDELNIHHIDLGSNIGPSSVDYAIPYIEKIGFKYVANVNSDMLFSDGWDIELIKLLESNYPCSTSACLVEPIYGGQQVYDTYDFFDVDSHEKFNEAVI